MHRRQRISMPSKWRTFAAVGSVLSLALTGCSNAETPASHNGLTVINIGLPVESGAQILPAIAQAAGFFKEEGLEANIRVISSSQANLAAMNTNQIQFANSDVLNALRGTAHGLGVEIIAVPIVKPIFDLIASNDIRTPKDIVGKRIGVTMVGNSTDFQVKLALKSVGVDPNSIKELGLDQYSGIYAGLESRQIDAGTVAVPFNNRLIATGKFHQLVNLRNISSAEYPTAIFTTTKKYASSHPEIVQKTVKAYVKAIRLYESDPEFAKKVSAGFLKLKDQKQIQETYDFFAPLFRTNPNVTAAQMQVVLPALADAEHMSKSALDPVVAKAVNTSFVDKAIKELGDTKISPAPSAN